MSARLAAVAALVAVAVGSSGCIWSPCGRSQGTMHTWDDPRLFAAFPAEGGQGAYQVEYHYENEYVPEKGGDGTPPEGFDRGQVISKHAFRTDGDEWPQLHVDRGGNATWQMYTYGKLGDEAAEREFRATFDALGLPAPDAAGLVQALQGRRLLSYSAASIANTTNGSASDSQKP